jgi:ferredoxin
MIIAKQKPFEEILEAVKDEKNIFIVGCSLCATTCKFGGEEEVKAIKASLEEKGKNITGWLVLDPGCHLLEVKKVLRTKKEELSKSDSILSMACGSGTQTVAEASQMIVHPATDPLFTGDVIRFGQFEERCSLCGQCKLDDTGAICPLTLCSKGLLNGPCGGSFKGKCEVDAERDCGWVLIYERLKKSGKLDKLNKIQDMQDHSKRIKPGKLNIREKKVSRLTS